MDIGGHRFFSKDDRVNQWWQNIMPTQGEPSYDDKILDREKSFAEEDRIRKKQTELCLFETEFQEFIIQSISLTILFL